MRIVWPERLAAPTRARYAAPRMNLRRTWDISTTDDRGAACRLRVLEDAYGGVPIADARMRALRARVRPILGTATGLTYAAAFFIAMLLTGVLATWLSFALQSALILLAVLAAIYVINARLPRFAHRIVTEYLRRGVCAGCGYNLFGLETQGDGCVLCPECGAAWRADRIETAEPFDEAARPTMLDRHRELLAPDLSLVRRRGFDDRGNRIELVPARLLRRAAADEAGFGARARSAAKEMRRSGRRARWLAAGFFVMIGAAFLLIELSMGVMLGPGPWRGVSLPMMLLPAGFMVVFGVVVARSELGVTARAVIDAAREAGVCAGCGGDLAGVAPAEDGCTVCPSCGAAWRLGPGERRGV